MALLGNREDRDDRSAAKAQRIMAKYGLENIDPQYADAVREIAEELQGTGLMKTGLALSSNLLTNEKDILRLQTHYQSAIMKQNFIMIRQLDQIAYMLEQMSR